MPLFPTGEFANRVVEFRVAQPLLTIVVDTEEEFDWSAPFTRTRGSVENALQQTLVQEIYDSHKIKPAYVLDQAMLEDAGAVDYFRGLEQTGRADLGVHLHPWLTPPYEEKLNSHNSFQGNLDSALEKAKIESITELFIKKIGRAPEFFKAGRYGVGPNTYGHLKSAGYKVDCSVVPRGTYQGVFGPDYRAMPHLPFWIDAENTFLAMPMTRNIVGRLSPLINQYWLSASSFFDNPFYGKLKIPGIMSALGLLERITLTPEGNSVEDLKKLLRVSVARGDTVFNLAYHSSSCLIGGSPYVGDAQQLNQFLATIREVIRYFNDELGGRVLSVPELHAQATAATACNK